MRKASFIAAFLAAIALLAFAGCKEGHGHTDNGGESCPISEETFPATDGVTYRLSDDGTYAIVTGYLGLDTQVRIASSYENVPVTCVDDYAFLNVESLTDVIFPETLKEIRKEAFTGCSSLTKIVVPDSVEKIGFGAFANCSGLTEITLPFAGESMENTENVHFGYIFGAENNAQNENYVPTSLKKVTLTKATTIGERAFYMCSSLTEVVLPDTLTKIDTAAFYLCSELIKIIIPNSVTYVGGYAFAYCYSITIYCERTEKDPSWGDRWNYDFLVIWGYTGE